MAARLACALLLLAPPAVSYLADRGDAPLYKANLRTTCTWSEPMGFYDCARLTLTAMPTDMPEKAETVGLSYNQLAGVLTSATWGGAAPANAATLLQLDLSHNKLTSLGDDAFAFVRNLTTLDVSHNRLTALTSAGGLHTTFDKVPNLRNLYIRGNLLAALDVAAFAKLTQLQRLDLGDNQLTALPASPGAFDQLAQLRWLSLRDNQIGAVPLHAFGAALQLRTLDLYGNAIGAFDTRTWDALSHLEVLRLSRPARTDVAVTEEDLVSCDGRPGLSKAVHFGPYNPQTYVEWLSECGFSPSGCTSHCITTTASSVCSKPAASAANAAPVYAPCKGELAHDHHCSFCCDSALDPDHPAPCPRYVNFSNYTAAGYAPPYAADGTPIAY